MAPREQDEADDMRPQLSRGAHPEHHALGTFHDIKLTPAYCIVPIQSNATSDAEEMAKVIGCVRAAVPGGPRASLPCDKALDSLGSVDTVWKHKTRKTLQRCPKLSISHIVGARNGEKSPVHKNIPIYTVRK
jgi:hypothetical protein